MHPDLARAMPAHLARVDLDADTCQRTLGRVDVQLANGARHARAGRTMLHVRAAGQVCAKLSTFTGTDAQLHEHVLDGVVDVACAIAGSTGVEQCRERRAVRPREVVRCGSFGQQAVRQSADTTLPPQQGDPDA